MRFHNQNYIPRLFIFKVHRETSGRISLIPTHRTSIPLGPIAKTFANFICSRGSSAIPPIYSSFLQASHVMRTILHLCVVLAVCQVALGAQLPYGNPTNPSPFAGQRGAQANSPFNEQDQRVPQQNVQPMYPDQRGRAAQPVPGYSSQPQQPQPNQYQQMMQQQQQQRPSGVYSSPVYMPFGMFSITKLWY